MPPANNSSFPQPEPLTPSDFPRAQVGAVSGFQTKILALKVGNKYAQGMPELEAYARYGICFDLVNQLKEYCHRKLVEQPDWTSEVLLQKLRIGVARRLDWGCTVDEQQWILKQLCHRMNWTPLASTSDAGVFKSLCPEVTITDPKIMDKLLGRKYDSDGKLVPPEPGPLTIVDLVRERLGSRPST